MGYDRKDKRLHAMATELARHLPGWKALPGRGYDGPDTAYLAPEDEDVWPDDDGHLHHERASRYLTLKRIWNKPDRFEVWGAWPSAGCDNYIFTPRDTPRPTFSLEREPEAVARDLERRYLDWYLGEHATLSLHAEKHDRRYFEKEALFERLADAIGGCYSADHRRDYEGKLRSSRDFSLWNTGGRARAHVKLPSHDAVTIELNLDPADALLVLRTLRKAEALAGHPHDDEEDD
jgi:hypothetical protein